jgi:outer membrane biosynthesis protein TonB
MNRFSNLLQFILGFFLGLVILAGGSAAFAYLFWMRMAASPPKPIFTEEKPKETTEVNQAASPAPSPTNSPANTSTETAKTEVPSTTKSPSPSPENVSKKATNTERKEASNTPNVSPSPEEKPQENPKQKEDLPAGSYKGRVSWSGGLSLRSDASKESSRVGGVDYNTELIIIQESPDKQWVKVRVSGSNQEGWVKAGNVSKSE